MKEASSNPRLDVAGESSTDQKESDDVKGLAAGKKQTRKKPKASRVVSNLNADQLERKRLVDRNAQRTVRQRTRDHISNLEARIEELVEEQAMLEDAERRTEALEEELRGLRLMLEKSRCEKASP
ncbi:bZIP transcription factor [Drepanopeziza brunnea f. sp. 'multigermtubi' MB_m1]|uniref:BZIP transcription factor n=1 Tax=Marssonina brunnea f. sp. multigermtubi (strain MB_m1) TaxID=1072389 RepID=K1X1D1_MARBU|nr:bZIP transcription factor [Drepanopeziza brunnea f. sp. 'multigermtubi' MB_m1]EKD19036.1 bZIP transcription factor [Drepanopeziza brunnea f. sp. 'multigermtubi' MB_m1]